MRILTFVVVLLVVAGVLAQTSPRPGGHNAASAAKVIIDQIVAESCQGIEEQCRNNTPKCLAANRPRVKTAEQLGFLKDCGRENGVTDPDFFSLTLENFTIPRGPTSFNPEEYGVPDEKIPTLLKCLMEKDGKLATFTACITGSS